MTNPTRIILDTDPALGVRLGTDIDDDLAIIMLLASPEIEILGITCTYGNSTINRTFYDARRLLGLAGRADIPVAKGAGWLSRNIDRETEASRFIAETIKANAGRVTMVTIGPLTNLATAIRHNPGIMDMTQELVIMGGRLVSGKTEFNFAAHPEATNIVLGTPVSKFMATMELCFQTAFTKEHLKQIEGDDSLLIHRFIPAIRRWLRINRVVTSLFAGNNPAMAKGGFYPWDPIGLAYLIEPQIFSDIIPLKVGMQGKRVITSEDIDGMDERLKVRAARKLDGERFMRILIERIKKVKLEKA